MRFVTYFSSNQTRIFLDHGIPQDRLAVLPFGVALDRPVNPDARHSDAPILAVGWDRGRDYATLFDAVDGTDLEVRVLARPENLAGLSWPSNVEVLGVRSRSDYEELLAQSHTVVVSTHELAYPTGQSVALEAAMAGCAVVVTDTPAMRDYFTHGKTAVMPAPGDVAGLRTQLLALHSVSRDRAALASAAHRHVTTHHTQAHLWSAFSTVVRTRLLGGDDQ